MKIMNDFEIGMEEINRGMTSLGYERTNNRLGSGLLGPTSGECMVNAIVSLTGLPYRKVYRKVAEANANWSMSLIGQKDVSLKDLKGKPANPYWFGKKTFRFGTHIHGRDFENYARSIGLEKITPKPYISISEAHREYGDCIVCFMTGNNNGHAAAIREGKLYDSGDSRISRWTDHKLEVDEWELADYFHRNGFDKDGLKKNGFGTIEEIKTNDSKKKWLVCGAWEPWAMDVWVEKQKTLYYLKYSNKAYRRGDVLGPFKRVHN